MKKVYALLLVAVMTVAMAVPTFAANSPEADPVVKTAVILNKALKEALGERGTPGNAEYIIYVAEKLIEVYKSDHLWAVDFKCISVPEMFEKLIEYTSELSKSIIEDIENFIDDYHKRIN